MAPVLPAMRRFLACCGLAALPAFAQEHVHEGGLAADVGGWSVMAHGFANAVIDHQGSSRGGGETFSNSMFMVDGVREAGRDALELRGMFSLDPLMGRSGYPLLFQTGETANGLLHLIDRQHPHDFFMELSATARRRLDERTTVSVSAGLPGDAALGPPVFMHRASGERIPEAPISHHWLDSTHVVFGVVTAGLTRGDWTFETSRFNAREPDQMRWDIETGSLDSSSARITWRPMHGLAMQASYGFLHDIEELQANVSIHRTTASVSWETQLAGRPWATTLAWGQNEKVDRHFVHHLPALLLESTLQPAPGHTVFVRAERIRHDDFSLELTFAKASAGYIVDMGHAGPVQLSLGALGTYLRPPGLLDFLYGKHPRGWMLFLQARL